MMRKLLIAMFALLLVSGCARTPDETRIREAITAMVDAVEARNPSDFMDHVAADFTGNDGQFDREQLERLLRVLVIGNSAPQVAVGPVDVEIAGERATVTLTVTVSGASSRWLRGRGGQLDIVSGWRLDDGEWRCYNATWSGEAADRMSRP